MRAGTPELEDQGPTTNALSAGRCLPTTGTRGNPSGVWPLAESRRQRMEFRESEVTEGCRTEFQRGRKYEEIPQKECPGILMAPPVSWMNTQVCISRGHSMQLRKGCL